MENNNQKYPESDSANTGLVCVAEPGGPTRDLKRNRLFNVEAQ